MNARLEICEDIICNCDIILDRLKDYPADNDTAEGRMVYQCRWLKEQAAAGTLPLPVRNFVSTLERVYADRDLKHLTKSKAEYVDGIEKVLYRLLNLVEGCLLLKPLYYPYAERCVNELLMSLKQSSRKLDVYEQGLIGELEKLACLLRNGEIQPPLMYYVPDYPNFTEVYSEAGSTIDDLTGGKMLMGTLANLIFEGVRPASWLTPEAADRETRSLRE